MIDYKLDYISRLFQRLSGKRIEHYVISRIWHLLDNYDIKILPQQYVSRNQIKYALTDIYFPQIGFHVEINESAHYISEAKIGEDIKRQTDIETVTGHRVFVIDCGQDLESIHSQIENLISEINAVVTKQVDDGVFKVWHPENEHNPEYWKNIGNISVEDEVTFHRIEDICMLFGADPRQTKRGYLRKASITNPRNSEQLIWWPSAWSRSGWLNSYNEINGTITESHTDEDKKVEHFNWHAQNPQNRIVFFHYKDILGRTSYKYVGVFTNDKEMSNPAIGTVWKRTTRKIKVGV